MQTDHTFDDPPAALRRFVDGLDTLLARGAPEPEVLDEGGRLLAALVARDDWLPPRFATPGDTYRQYALHRDPAGRFSVVAFVWGPGQSTPIHDHGVWGLIGMLRGAEDSQGYRFVGPARLAPAGAPVRLAPGQVEAVSPSIGDIHQVRNAFDDRVSISIHAYGADIGVVERATYDLEGRRRAFVSGYTPLP